ncbi:filament-like plant protein 4 [Aristolochia californica]|uniref:filament-like plant protein 4 n=1 Tax=Aristolochia californica TaxID=171875 RepID=UPI0035D7B83A
MDRRSWPWKKKSSSEKEKAIAATESNASSANSAGTHGNEDISKKVKYVQITEETYTKLKDQVKDLEDQVNDLENQVKDLNENLSSTNEKLASALAENTTKENLVKQHAKVAEEAVSGWEKVEAEAIALKSQLESVTLLKLTAEDRGAHLDGALKECMRQIRNVKEESEQKLHDVVFAKTKQWEKIKGEFESRIVDLEQELLRASADNNTLSRSLQERSNLLVKMSEEKSQADAQIEVLKSNVQSCEKEINSLKYEIHIVSKELEIRNEEKNMNLRSAEVVNKQHLEGVKKITKLEAECQRLRGLVRKKLPGPAALAQMKLEVESLGRDYGETRLRRSPVKSSSPHMAPPTEFSLESIQQSRKETEFLTARLLTTEEETKMLKEALSKRNSELQASRNICAKATSKLRSLEAQIQFLSQQRSPSKLNLEIPLEGSLSQSASNPPSTTSMSEDGVDEEASCADSWATALISELSHIKKEKNVERANKTESSKHLELMDDFLEMERLACLSTESNGIVSVSDNVIDKGIQKTSPEFKGAKSSSAESNKKEVTKESIQSRITLIFDSQGKDSDVCKILEDIRKVVEDMQGTLPHQSVQSISGESKVPAEGMLDTENGISLKCEYKPCIETTLPINQELERATYEIQRFIASLGKQAKEIQSEGHDGQCLIQMIDEFSNSVDKVFSGELGVVNFIYELSCVLAKATELNFNIVGIKGNEGENNVSDCVDKVTLLENKVIEPDQTKERFSSDCPHVSDSISHPEIIRHGCLGPSFELRDRLCKCSQDEIEQLKLERENLALDLVRCNESLEQRTVRLDQTEKLLEELESQLASSQKSNSLAETQLKCMAESYKSLETRTQDLETEMNLLHERAKGLEIELQEEKRNHYDAVVRCKDLEVKCNDLEEQIQRTEKCSMCSPSLADDSEKIKQERDIAAAAEKLAECQETILLLGKQLNALRSPPRGLSTDMQDNESSASGLNSRGPGSQDFDQTDRVGGEASLNNYSGTMSSSDTEPSPFTRSPINSKRPKHKASRSSSSASSVVMTPEKNSRGFSRFFSRG